MKTELITFGIEIEGEFAKGCTTGGYGVLKNDGSLHSNKNTPENYEMKELESVVFHDWNTAKKLFSLIDPIYRPNDTAGFHIHLGFNPKMPPEIMSVEFSKYLIAKIKKHYPKAYEKRKNNRFCLPNSENDNDVINSKRYCAVNYQAMGDHGTIEIRIYPSDTPQVMKHYLASTLLWTRNYLKNTIKTSYKVNFDDETTHTTRDFLRQKKLYPMYDFVSLKK